MLPPTIAARIAIIFQREIDIAGNFADRLCHQLQALDNWAPAARNATQAA